MSKLTAKVLLASIMLAASTAQLSHAQTSVSEPTLEEKAAEQAFRNKRIKRDVKPIAYWVDSPSLRLRDNPVAGNVVGSLDFGHIVFAYAQYENWVRVSKTGTKQRWVNSDFLSNSRLSWVNYDRSAPRRTSDVLAVRIKDPSNRKNRIFGVRLKTAETGNVLITTRQNTDQGALFQNRFVSCEDQRPIGVRLVGEGQDFLTAQNDVRNNRMDIYSPDQIEDKSDDSSENAISAFACKAQAF